MCSPNCNGIQIKYPSKRGNVPPVVKHSRYQWETLLFGLRVPKMTLVALKGQHSASHFPSGGDRGAGAPFTLQVPSWATRLEEKADRKFCTSSARADKYHVRSHISLHQTHLVFSKENISCKERSCSGHKGKAGR